MEPRDEFRPSGSPMSGGQGEAGRLADEVKEQVKGVASQAREGASRLADKAKEQARTAVEQRKDQAASSLDSLSSVLRDGAGRLHGEKSFFGDYAESAADRVDRLARYLRDSDPERFLRDAEDFARRRPEVFMGGMLVAGLLLGRFLKSSTPETPDNDFVYAGGGGAGGSGAFGKGTPATGMATGSTGSFSGAGARSDVQTSWQESGAYGGSTPPRPNATPAATPGSTPGGTTPGGTPNRLVELAPDDETDLGL